MAISILLFVIEIKALQHVHLAKLIGFYLVENGIKAVKSSRGQSA